MPDIRQHLAILEGAVARGVGDPAPAFVEAHSTVQVKDYSRYAMDGRQPDAHLVWRDAPWAPDLAAARAPGHAMAEQALACALSVPCAARSSRFPPMKSARCCAQPGAASCP